MPLAVALEACSTQAGQLPGLMQVALEACSTQADQLPCVMQVPWSGVQAATEGLLQGMRQSRGGRMPLTSMRPTSSKSSLATARATAGVLQSQGRRSASWCQSREGRRGGEGRT